MYSDTLEFLMLEHTFFPIPELRACPYYAVHAETEHLKNAQEGLFVV
jgi:hypothetical protein